MGDYLTTKECAKLLKVTEQTLRKWRGVKNGPSYIKLGSAKRSKVLYSRETVDLWMKSREVHFTDPPKG